MAYLHSVCAGFAQVSDPDTGVAPSDVCPFQVCPCNISEDSGVFINSGGRITLIREVNFEAETQLELLLSCRDPGGLVAENSIYIQVPRALAWI